MISLLERLHDILMFTGLYSLGALIFLVGYTFGVMLTNYQHRTRHDQSLRDHLEQKHAARYSTKAGDAALDDCAAGDPGATPALPRLGAGGGKG